MNPMTILFIKFVPKNLLSFLVGILVSLRIPWVGNWAAKIFARQFKINLEEAEKDISQYKNIQQLFTRRLKPGIRPIQGRIVHPCDSEITANGNIESGSLIQAKGKAYQLKDLLQNHSEAKKFINGCFATYYLCPTDYHRVHSPFTGRIRKIDYIPGNLWPVNRWSVNSIDSLFSVNERLNFYIENEEFSAVLVMVGATNVGKITSPYLKNFASNQFGPARNFDNINQNIEVGQELGCFEMGSTVVMIYNDKISDRIHFTTGQVQLGEKLI